MTTTPRWPSTRKWPRTATRCLRYAPPAARRAAELGSAREAVAQFERASALRLTQIPPPLLDCMTNWLMKCHCWNSSAVDAQ